eukprot:scaffold52942_cov50-Phaeocystis_antarctica.AAC.4
MVCTLPASAAVGDGRTSRTGQEILRERRSPRPGRMARGAPGHLGIIHLRPMVFIKNSLVLQQPRKTTTRALARRGVTDAAQVHNTNECLRPVLLCGLRLWTYKTVSPPQINPRSPALPIAFASPKCVCHGRPQIATVGPQIAHWTRGTAHSIGRGNTAPAAPRPPARAPAPPSPCAHRFLLVRRPLRRP